jgi:hypothetical protein
MYKQIEVISSAREKILKLVAGLSEAQMNEIPDGFNNNFAWHIGHLVVTQQSLCYGRAGIAMLIDNELLEKYKPGTKPEAFISTGEIEALIALFTMLPQQLRQDCIDHVLDSYTPWTAARYGIEITNIDDALSFVAFHEGIHYGYMAALKRALNR